MMTPVLEVRDLVVSLTTRSRVLRPVDGMSFSLSANETLAIVGESGSGKSMTARAILRLLPSRIAKIAQGQVLFDGRDLVSLDEPELQKIRGADISMIFQEPMTALNPVQTVGGQIMDVLKLHRRMTAQQRRDRAIELLELVGIPDPATRIADYPHRLSGGMRQRALIAMALACEPKILLADEPTTALDVTVQAQVMDLLGRLRRSMGMGMLLITHDLSLVAETANRVAVMYGGRKVEEGPVRDIFKNPLHPYTKGLLAATPRPEKGARERRQRLRSIEGTVPSLLNLPKGCAFAPRCDQALDQCRAQVPGPVRADSGREVSCFVAQRQLQSLKLVAT
jgi:peptide/nickel transport system ATP-binding protein